MECLDNHFHHRLGSHFISPLEIGPGRAEVGLILRILALAQEKSLVIKVWPEPFLLRVTRVAFLQPEFERGPGNLETLPGLFVLEQARVGAVVPWILAGVTFNCKGNDEKRTIQIKFKVYQALHGCHFSTLSSSFPCTRSLWWSSCLVCNTCKVKLMLTLYLSFVFFSPILIPFLTVAVKH